MTDPIPPRLFMGTTWRDAEPGETIEAWIGQGAARIVQLGRSHGRVACCPPDLHEAGRGGLSEDIHPAGRRHWDHRSSHDVSCK